MELGTMFTEQRWNILKSLSEGKFSPLQLSESSNTTIANISQQLRLLEAANLVKKEKIKNRDKGKPRALFSLTNDYAYLVATMKDFAKKKQIVLSDFHKTILKILFLENVDHHYYLAKFYWKIEEYLDQITGIMVMRSSEEIDVVIVAKNAKEIRKKINSTIDKPNDKTMTVKILGLTQDEFTKQIKQGKGIFASLDNLQTIYDPDGILSNLTKEVNN